ncbi:serine/threonine-protein kinase [Bremerella sp. P1]|uniref:serine/threonine-protein kinase n=1 Tax=Bremerella sp. P1 TaxID=3026424 RepID=UPI0023685BF7|nr:serine/threonine-protein kinase [Bremerella sp. P1]WDI42257.1 serine/threonine-protein kinase [Bremerella sp. P1]
MSSPQRSVHEIFLQAISIPDEAERQEFVNQSCAGAPEHRERVEQLLRARGQARSGTLSRAVGDLEAGEAEGPYPGTISSAPESFPAPARSDGIENAEASQKFAMVDGMTGEHGFLAPGSVVGAFEIIERVGNGGMGHVFLARDRRLSRDVALKMPRLDVLGVPGLYRRFLQEARTAAQLDHPALVSILEAGAEGPFLFIASQWCRGGDLAAWLEKNPGPHSPMAVAAFVAKLADAIAYCHSQGILHLDLKPSNILLTDEDADQQDLSLLNFKVADFGIARFFESETVETSLSSLMLGTPQYMSPEQAINDVDALGPETDTFALGVIAYELLAGSRPFEGKSAIEVLKNITEVEFVEFPSELRIPRDLQTICLHCLEKKKQDRYESAQRLIDDLNNFLNNRPISVRRVSPLRKLWLWMQRPARMTYAGIVAIAVQAAFLAMMVGPLISPAIGIETPDRLEFDQWLSDALPLALFVHFPSFWNSIRTMQYKRFASTIGTLFSVFSAAFLLAVLWGIASPLTVYQDEPVAKFVVHFALAMVTLSQLGFYLLALPAAWKNRTY